MRIHTVLLYYISFDVLDIRSDLYIYLQAKIDSIHLDLDLLVTKFCPAIRLFWTTTVQNIRKSIRHQVVLGLLTPSSSAAVCDYRRVFCNIGQRHRLGISIENEILGHGPIRIGRQGCHGQTLLVAGLFLGIRISHVDDEQTLAGLGDEITELLGRCDACLSL